MRTAAVVVSIASTLLLGACGDQPSRQEAVAERGAAVMPFDLDATTHEFTPTADGGVQTVTADDPADSEQVDLIRGHLAAERDAFASGDFDDPVTIHGEHMPGVAELRAGAGRIDVRYEDVDAGGRLVYATDDTALVTAIHDWFEAQRMDHGEHATSGG